VLAVFVFVIRFFLFEFGKFAVSMQSVRSDKSDGVNPPIYYVVVGGANQVRRRTTNSQNESLLVGKTNQLSVRVRMRVCVGSRACDARDV
jgi:hypothetical protein